MLPSPESAQDLATSRRISATKPVRLRTACNQCCSAKVKCSGERTGCQRCRNMRTQCIYMESRVGKVPGIRAKKRRLDCDQQSENQGHMATRVPSVITSSGYDTSSPPEEEDALTQWHQDSTLDIPYGDADFLQDSSTSALGSSVTQDTLLTTMSEDCQLPAMDFNLDNLLQSFPPSPSNGVNKPQRMHTPTGSTSEQNDQRAQNTYDSQFVINCTQIISDLENYIVADVKSLKLVLGLVKRALEKVVQLSDTQQAARNMRCTILLTAMLYQIVELLEACFYMLSEDLDQQKRPSFGLRPTSGLLLPGLGLGDFGVDIEEQNAWRNQMVLKEVRQAGEVLRKMKMLASKGPEQTPAANGHGRAREQCFVDLELRLSDLASRIVGRR